MEATVERKKGKRAYGISEPEVERDEVIGLRGPTVSVAAPTEAEIAEMPLVKAMQGDAAIPVAIGPCVFYLTDSANRLRPYPAVVCEEEVERPGTWKLVRFVAGSPMPAQTVRMAVPSREASNGCFVQG